MTHPTNTAILTDDEINAIGHGKDWGMAWCVAFARQVERAVIEKLGATDAVPAAHYTNTLAGRTPFRLYTRAPHNDDSVPLYDATALAHAHQQGYDAARAEFGPDAELNHLRRLAELVTRADEDRASRDWDSQRLNWAEAYDEARKSIAARKPTQKDAT